MPELRRAGGHRGGHAPPSPRSQPRSRTRPPRHPPQAYPTLSPEDVAPPYHTATSCSPVERVGEKNWNGTPVPAPHSPQLPPQPRAEPPAFTRVLPLQLLTAMAESGAARASHSAGRWLRHTATRLPQRRMRSPTRWPGATAASYCGRQRGRPSDLASVPSVSCRSWNWDPMTLASPSTVSPNPSSYFFLDPFSIFVQGPLDF